MKKFCLLILMCASTLSASAAFRTYLCGITDLSVDTLESTKKNQFIVTFNQKCKNTAEYGKPDTYYESTVTLYLNSDDRTLDGVYTTEGVDPYSTSHVNDQTINMVYSEFTSGSTSRKLRRDTVSTFVITKISATQYAITECTLFFSQRVNQVDTWQYKYSYDANDILTQGIEQTPFIFTYEEGFRTIHTHYDMSISAMNIERHDTDYGTERYFLTLACQGTCRTTGQSNNYEIQLAIYPEGGLAGTYSTSEQRVMYASNSYVKDLASNKMRYLESDSASTIHISSKGDNQYILRADQLICTDIDMNHLAVYGEKLVTQAHYYHFTTADSIAFSYNPNDRNIPLTIKEVEQSSNESGAVLTVHAANNVVNYTVDIQLETNDIVGTHSFNHGLSRWSSVMHGTTYSYLTGNAVVKITKKATNLFTIEGTLSCENGNTYILQPSDFGDGTGDDEDDDDQTDIYLTASAVDIQDLSVDKLNYFVTVAAAVNNSEYEVAFDLWPTAASAIGTFSAEEHTISYINSYVHKVRYMGEEIDTYYACASDSRILLTIEQLSDSTATISATIEALSARGTRYTYHISPFVFPYTQEEVIDPQQDAYRFEPNEPTNIDFAADVINFRQKSDYIEITLNEMANETYDWIELRLLSSTMALPEGNYSINDSGETNTLTASQGYLGSQTDDPCFLAIRADKQDWGAYTPYYLVSGQLSVSYNEKGDTITITGQAQSYHGSNISIHAQGYNMLYIPEEEPEEPEYLTLLMDTVQITYLSQQSDTANSLFRYTMNFFQRANDYPNVIVDVIMSKPMSLVEGSYTLADGQLSNLHLYQDQEDFNDFFFGGIPYVFTSATLHLAPTNDGQWSFAMEINDQIGSQYTFTLTQKPHIIQYPSPSDNPIDAPYADEVKSPSDQSFMTDTLAWDDSSVDEDGILEITLYQRQADDSGLHALIHLGMVTSTSDIPAATYLVSPSEEDNTFIASLGRYGNTAFPSYAALVYPDGWVQAIWYLVDGEIQVSYSDNGDIRLEGHCTSYFGSDIHFTYGAPSTHTTDVMHPYSPDAQKLFRNGQLIILRDGKEYNALGQPL